MHVTDPPCRAFMDDITVSTSSIQGTRWIISALERMANWARMEFKPEKSRSLAINKGKVTHSFTFKIQGKCIPTINQHPIKCLGKRYDESLGDSSAIADTFQQLKEWLKAIDQTSLQGRFKAWCFQFGVIPRLQWPFLLYEIPMSTIQNMEKACSKFLRKWMGVPPCFSTTNLYSKSSKLSLPLSSISEEFKATKVRAITILQSSKDLTVHKAGDQQYTGRKWNARDEMKRAQEQLRHHDIVGTVCKGRLGLGNYGTCHLSGASAKDKRDRVVQQTRQLIESERMASAVGQPKQCTWTQWDSALDMSLTWNEIWKTDQSKLSFMLRSFADLLPSPANLRTWGLAEAALCYLCGTTNCTLCHILSSCPKALAEGRYRWRHDKVLREIANWIDTEVRKANQGNRSQITHFISFHREGQPRPKNTKCGRQYPSILSRASDWELQVDLKSRLVFPTEVVETCLLYTSPSPRDKRQSRMPSSA